MRKSVRMHAAGKRDAGGGGQRTHALQVTKRGRVSGSNAPWNLRVRDDIRRWAHLPGHFIPFIRLSISTLVRSARTDLIRGEFLERGRRLEIGAPLNLGPVIIDACDRRIRIRSIKTR